jgi:hypothetical protein
MAAPASAMCISHATFGMVGRDARLASLQNAIFTTLQFVLDVERARDKRGRPGKDPVAV